MSNSPTFILEQGADPLTLRARFDLQVNAVLVYDNGTKVEDLTAPTLSFLKKFLMKDIEDLLPYFKDNFVEISDRYLQIEEWLREEPFIFEGKEIIVKNIVGKLLSKDEDTIEMLWEVLKDTEIYEWIDKNDPNDTTQEGKDIFSMVIYSTINELNDSLIEDIYEYLKRNEFNKGQTKRTGLIAFRDYISYKLNKSGAEKPNYYDATLKFIKMVESYKYTLEEIIKSIDEEFGLSVVIDLNDPEKSNFNEVFWKLSDLEGFIEYNFKKGFLNQLDTKEYQKLLIDWKHNPNIKPFIVKYLELKRWNYRLFLAGILGIGKDYPDLEELKKRWSFVRDCFLYWNSNPDEKWDKELVPRLQTLYTIPASDVTSREALNKEAEGMITKVKNTSKELLEIILTTRYQEREDFSDISPSQKEKIYYSTQESVLKETFYRLRTAIFGKIEKGIADTAIAVIQAIESLIDITFKRALSKENDKHKIDSKAKWHNLNESIKRYEAEIKELLCDNKTDFSDTQLYERLVQLHERICDYKQEFKEMSRRMDRQVNERDVIPNYILFDYSVQKSKAAKRESIRKDMATKCFGHPDVNSILRQKYNQIQTRIDKNSGLTVCEDKKGKSYRMAYEKFIKNKTSEVLINDYFYKGEDPVKIKEAKKQLATPMNVGQFLLLCDIFEASFEQWRHYLSEHREICEEVIEAQVEKELKKLNDWVELGDGDANKMRATWEYIQEGGLGIVQDGIKQNDLWVTIAEKFFNKKKFRPSIDERKKLWEMKLVKGGGLLLYGFLKLSYQPTLIIEVEKIKELKKFYSNGI